MPYRDPRLPVHRRAAALVLEAGRSRAALKALGRWLDEEAPELKPAVLELARRRGVELPDEAVEWPGKRLLRLARGREAPSRQRRNPIRRDEAFTCAACGREVPPGGARVRDHCPYCLRSLHVDRVPGDRAAGCGGIMEPVGAELAGRAGIVILYRCRRCGHEHRNRALVDGPVPDDPEALRRLLAGEGPPPLPGEDAP